MADTQSYRLSTLDTSLSKADASPHGEPTPNTTLQPATDVDADDSHHSSQDDGYLTGLPLNIVMINVTAVAFLALLDTSIISTAIPSITDDFKSLPDIGWYGSAYQLSSAALQPLTGKIYTKLSLKWSFLAFLCLFELGSLLCGVASSSKMLIIARAIAGMGGAGLMNGAITIISSCVPLSKRATLTGILMGISQLGVVCGPLLGGALTQYSTWRWVFLINLPIGAVVAAILCFVRIPDQVKKESTKSVLLHLHHHLDFVGFMLVAPAAVQLLLAVQYGGNDFAWNSSTVIGLFCGSGATFAVWYAWNWYRGDAALIPLSIASQRVVWCSSITQMGLMTTLYVTNFFLSVYFQAILGANAMMSGVYLLGTILSQLVFTILSGVFVTKTGFVLPYAIFGSIATTVGVGLFSLLQPSTPTATWVGFQVLSGIGRGISMQMPFIAIQSVLEGSDFAIATSLIMFTQFLGTAVFLALANTIFNNSIGSELHKHAPTVNAEQVIQAGATEFRELVSDQQLPGILQAYANSVDRVFYLVAGAGALSVLTVWGMGWVDIRQKKETTPEAEAVSATASPLPRPHAGH